MKRRITAVALAAVLSIGTVSVLAGCGGKGGANSFTWFLSNSDNMEYYTKYEENPVMQYLMAQEWNDADGAPQKIDISFEAPVTSSAGEERFNNMIQTQSESDILTTTFSKDGIMGLYDLGVTMDITEYVTAYMPNYVQMLKDRGVYEYATYQIEGKEGRRFLGIGGYTEIDFTAMFCGWCYRRDWIVTYGEPCDGQKAEGVTKFEGEAPNGDYDEWTDNVKFPSFYQAKTKEVGLAADPDWDGSYPLFISDWEWMFEIFEKAQTALGIDNYLLSLFYPGYNENGDLVSSFGGGNPAWYQDENGVCHFGGVSDNFKAYLEAMRSWNDKGWLDKNFATRTRDAFYSIDSERVAQGSVGLWCGQTATLGNRLENAAQKNTKGIMVMGARNPINDVYGGDAQKYKVPDSFFAAEPFSGTGLCFAAKAKNKNWASLFRMLDYLYSEEGSVVRTVGLSKEQLATAPQSVRDYYKKYGAPDGTYTVVEENGETRYRLLKAMDEDENTFITLIPKRLDIGLDLSAHVSHNYGKAFLNSRNEWVAYENVGFFGGLIRSQMTAAENKLYSSRRNELLMQTMQQYVPRFILGSQGWTLEKNWDGFVGQLNKIGHDDVTAIFQRILDAYKAN